MLGRLLMKGRFQFPKSTDRCILNPAHDHDRIVFRSRLYHRLISDKLRQNSDLFLVARNNLRRWMNAEIARNGFPSHAYREWADIFRKKTHEEILEILTSDTYDADRLRSSTPFCGILTEGERLAILESHGSLAA